MEFQHSAGFQQNLAELMEEVKVLVLGHLKVNWDLLFQDLSGWWRFKRPRVTTTAIAWLQHGRWRTDREFGTSSTCFWTWAVKGRVVILAVDLGNMAGYHNYLIKSIVLVLLIFVFILVLPAFPCQYLGARVIFTQVSSGQFQHFEGLSLHDLTGDVQRSAKRMKVM